MLEPKIPYNRILIVICVAAVALFVVNFSSQGEECYIASDRPFAKAFAIGENGELEETDPLVRGTKAETTKREIDGYSGVKIDDDIVYVKPESIVASRSEIVQEKKLFVRTPATIYTDKSGPSIEGFAPKGSELQITGHTKVTIDGTVKKYQVHYGDVTGYVYGKYLVRDEKDAKENCNDNGAYDMAKKAKFNIDLHGGKATNLDYYPYEFVPIKGNDFCDDARAMYLHAGATVSDKYFELAKKSGVNAVVINIDGGTLAYKSQIAKEMCPSAYDDAHYSVEKFQKAVKKYSDAGMYTIGRIVAFNDPHYAADHKEACIMTGKKRTKWASAYDRGIWEYKVSMAIEAVETMGFNEIQFDYVRFPEESYEMSVSGNTDFRNKYKEEKAQAIQNFCFYAADQIHDAGAYVSIDVFGESSNGYVTAYGQYWPAISNVVDAISAMPYTDHHGDGDTWSHPYNTLYNWAKRSAKMQKKIPTPACPRTWITGYNTPYWNPTVSYDYKKLRTQVKALEDAGLVGGFIPWNSQSDYEKYKQYSKIWQP